MTQTAGSDIRTELNRLILRAEWHMSNQLADFLKQQGGNMSPAGWLVLETLVGGKGMSMSELCFTTGSNDSTLTKVVDKMVSDSLVFRRPDPKDRRKVIIFRSKRGATLHEKLKSQVENSYKDLFPNCSDEQVLSLVGQLQSLMAKDISA
ncbi:MAG: DNA-binding MarR family transcriptional regulator [Halioglobus sp.]|jgi:DNA-binding MarR family transcriptional regulator